MTIKRYHTFQGSLMLANATGDYCLYSDIAPMQSRIAELEARLEIDPAHSYDGIDCRDVTIRELERENTYLRARLDQAHELMSTHSLDVAFLRAKVIEEAATECERMMMFPGGRQESFAHHGVQAAARAIRALTPATADQPEKAE